MYFEDIVNASLLRRKYQEYERALSSNNVSEIKAVIRDFLNFVKSVKFYVSDALRSIIESQEKIAKELILVIRVRYLIIFAYKTIIRRLAHSLVNAIRSFQSLLTA